MEWRLTVELEPISIKGRKLLKPLEPIIGQYLSNRYDERSACKDIFFTRTSLESSQLLKISYCILEDRPTISYESL